MKLSPSLLSDLDKELQVPADWTEKAKKEGRLIIIGTSSPDDTRASFRERYPFIKMEVQTGTTRDRSVKTLMAFKSGRVVGDIVESVGETIVEFKKSNALTDLRDIPGFANVLNDAKDPEGLWVGQTSNVYCLGYNTKLVRKADLPQRWEDLLTIPAWRNGNLALVNRPNNWLLQLWKLKGEEWAKHFMTRLFTEVKPQRRKEGQSASVAILGAGEFHGHIPASQSGVYQEAVKGLPVSLHCPEPVPSNLSEELILRGSPNPYAAKIYLNWTLSKEGQLAGAASHHAPVHKDLQQKELIRYGETVVGKQRAFADLNDEINLLPAIMPTWEKLWLSK
jgi:iron(III) transport system substrate-binding protein